MPKPSRNDLLVIDVETSGVNPFRHEVLSVALVPVLSRLPVATVNIRPARIQWQDSARAIHSIYADDWRATAIPAWEACRSIERYLARVFPGREATPVGHNVGFDLAFLRKLAHRGGRVALAGLSHRAVDTHTLLYVLAMKGRIPSNCLTSDRAFRYFRIEPPPQTRHTALGDALATRRLILKLLALV